MSSTISFATTETKAELATSDDRVDLANLATSRLPGEPTNCPLRETASNLLRDMGRGDVWWGFRLVCETAILELLLNNGKPIEKRVA